MTSEDAIDRGYMKNALALASRGLGSTAPNPSVGCILVKGGVVLGRGWTQPGGRPHAETQALKKAGDAAKGSTAYVTLEPCCHHGKTPPCTDALIAAGVSRVVIATPDPDQRVDGGGVEALTKAGLEVTTGLMPDAASGLNAGFFKVARKAFPYIALKSASSMDGRIALANGKSQWITGEAARRFGHLLRSQYDAVLVGSGTAIADNPSLTCRLPGVDRVKVSQPIRVILDRRLRVDEGSLLVSSASMVPTWVITDVGADSDKVFKLEKHGVVVLKVSGGPDSAFAMAAAQILAERGITRVLIEGGGQVASSFLRAGLIDRIYSLRAPIVIGGDGKPAIAGLDLTQLLDAPTFKRVETKVFGKDILEILDREPTV